MSSWHSIASSHLIARWLLYTFRILKTAWQHLMDMKMNTGHCVMWFLDTPRQSYFAFILFHGIMLMLLMSSSTYGTFFFNWNLWDINIIVKSNAIRKLNSNAFHSLYHPPVHHPPTKNWTFTDSCRYNQQPDSPKILTSGSRKKDSQPNAYKKLYITFWARIKTTIIYRKRAYFE